MKKSILTLATCAALFGSSAQAAPITPRSLEVAKSSSELDQAVAHLIVLTQMGKTVPGDVAQVAKAVANLEDPFAPDPESVQAAETRRRLMLHVQSLIVRAQNAFLSLQDAYELREDTVNARLAFAIEQLEFR